MGGSPVGRNIGEVGAGGNHGGAPGDSKSGCGGPNTKGRVSADREETRVDGCVVLRSALALSSMGREEVLTVLVVGREEVSTVLVVVLLAGWSQSFHRVRMIFLIPT